MTITTNNPDFEQGNGGYTLTVIREGAERVRNESDLFYQLRNVLRARGHDVIKKRPDRDGHLFSAPWYLRERKWRFCVYDPMYAVRDAAKDFNQDGKVDFQVEWGEGE